jgi:hypothetical protein
LASSKCRPAPLGCYILIRVRKPHYVIEGASVESPDGKQLTLAPGTAAINVRDVPHGAFKVTGDKALKLLTVHIVDKGKQMFTAVKP